MFSGSKFVCRKMSRIPGQDINENRKIVMHAKISRFTVDILVSENMFFILKNPAKPTSLAMRNNEFNRHGLNSMMNTIPTFGLGMYCIDRHRVPESNVLCIFHHLYD